MVLRLTDEHRQQYVVTVILIVITHVITCVM